MLNNNAQNNSNMPEPDTTHKLLQHLRALKHIKYLVPCKETSESSKKPETAVFVSPTGDKYLAAFTNTAELSKWPYKHDKTELLSYDDLKFIVLNNPKNMAGIVLDPFSKRLLLRQEQLEQIDLLTDGFGIRCIEHSEAMHLSKLAKEMPELIAALNVFLASKKNVYTAYMVMVIEPEETQSHLLFIIDFDGEKSDLFPSLAKVISPHIEYGGYYEMMKATYNLLNAAAAVSKPVFQRP